MVRGKSHENDEESNMINDSNDIHDTSDESGMDDDKEKTYIQSLFYSKLSTFIDKITSINKDVKELQNIGKMLEKDFTNVIKVFSKKKTKPKLVEAKKVNGFSTPTQLSSDMCTFLKIDQNTELARKDVTKLISKYIIDNNLRNGSTNKNAKRNIILDDNLKKLFNCGDDEHVTLFNLQSYIKHHFLKNKKCTINNEEISDV